MLIAAMNPCQCGFFTDRTRECLCTPAQIQRYRAKVSGPLLDRIDIHIEVPTVPFKELTLDPLREDSKAIRERVHRARKMQVERYKREGIYCNSQLNPKQLKKYCELDDDSQKLFEMAMNKLSLSARAYHRILKVSRTIADLDQRGRIGAQDVSEAIQYRTLDRKNIV
jgi:magnesium chelatase family protein